MNNSVKNTTKKVETKKVVTKKANNKQFSHLQSSNKKELKLSIKNSLVLTLLECKKATQLEFINESNYDNQAELLECKKAINYFVKLSKEESNEEFILFSKAVRKSKKGEFVEYFTDQLVQHIVSQKLAKNREFKDSLNILISKQLEKKAKAKKAN